MNKTFTLTKEQMAILEVLSTYMLVDQMQLIVMPEVNSKTFADDIHVLRQLELVTTKILKGKGVKYSISKEGLRIINHKEYKEIE